MSLTVYSLILLGIMGFLALLIFVPLSVAMWHAKKTFKYLSVSDEPIEEEDGASQKKEYYTNSHLREFIDKCDEVPLRYKTKKKENPKKAASRKPAAKKKQKKLDSEAYPSANEIMKGFG